MRVAALRRDWGMPILVAACIGLQAFGTSANLPMFALAVIGLLHVARAPGSVLHRPQAKTLLALFACLWLPMLLALPGAFDPARSAGTALVFALFVFMGLAMLAALSTPERQRRVVQLVGAVLAFWAFDALVQAYAGVNLFGMPHIGGQLTGLFYPDQRLGTVLAVLAPVFWLWLRALARRQPWLWLLAVPYVLTILLSGKRNAWILLSVALALGALALLMRLSWRKRLAAFGLMALASLTTATVVMQNPHFQAKFAATTDLVSRDFARADAATSWRLTIWRVALKMQADHWINGIGPRNFRYVYPDYARADDIFMRSNPHSGPTHPHQIVLEIGVETGVIGLIGYLLLLGWLLRELWRAQRARADTYLAWLIALAAALFPLSAGHALYNASFWGGVTFWLLFMALAHRPPRRA